MELQVVEAILIRVEAKLDSLDRSVSDRHNALEARIRQLESTRDKLSMLAVVAGFVMPVIVTIITKKAF